MEVGSRWCTPALKQHRSYQSVRADRVGVSIGATRQHRSIKFRGYIHPCDLESIFHRRILLLLLLLLRQNSVVCKDVILVPNMHHTRAALRYIQGPL